MLTTLACALQPPIMYSSLGIIRLLVALGFLILIVITIIKIIWDTIRHRKIFNPTTYTYLTTSIVFLIGSFLEAFLKSFLVINNYFGDYWENYWILYLYWGIVFAVLWWISRKKASNKWLLIQKIITILLLVLSLTIYIAVKFFSEIETTSNNTIIVEENLPTIPHPNKNNLPDLIPFSNVPFGCTGEPRIF